MMRWRNIFFLKKICFRITSLILSAFVIIKIWASVWPKSFEAVRFSKKLISRALFEDEDCTSTIAKTLVAELVSICRIYGIIRTIT